MNDFGKFFWRITSSHIITYFFAGVLAYGFLDYKDLFSTPPFSYFMRPSNAAIISAGPVLQIIRGFIFTLALWPFRKTILETNYGWLKLWGLLLGLSILSTASAAPGSIEGFIYTTIPINKQVIGYFELMPQTLLFSLIVYYWYKRQGKSWNVISIILVTAIILMSIMGYIMQSN